MAVSMRDRVAGAPERKWAKRGYTLDLGAGITGGYATIGAIGVRESGRTTQPSARVTNLAARLYDQALPGHIFISRKFYRVQLPRQGNGIGGRT